jgi:hypothetical protein
VNVQQTDAVGCDATSLDSCRGRPGVALVSRPQCGLEHHVNWSESVINFAHTRAVSVCPLETCDGSGCSRIERGCKTQPSQCRSTHQTVCETEKITTGSVGSLGMAFDEGRGQLRNVM